MELEKWTLKQRVLLVAAICAGLLGLVGLLVLTGYRCPILAVTGVLCPGCGVTTGVLYLLQFQFRYAWQANPMVYPLVVLVVFFLVQLVRGKLTNRQLIIGAVGYVALSCVVWCVRVLL